MLHAADDAIREVIEQVLRSAASQAGDDQASAAETRDASELLQAIRDRVAVLETEGG